MGSHLTSLKRKLRHTDHWRVILFSALSCGQEEHERLSRYAVQRGVRVVQLTEAELRRSSPFWDYNAGFKSRSCLNSIELWLPMEQKLRTRSKRTFHPEPESPFIFIAHLVNLLTSLYFHQSLGTWFWTCCTANRLSSTSRLFWYTEQSNKGKGFYL